MVGANCNDKASLVQLNDDADPYPKPPNGFAWDSWNPDSLPSCHHWRNAAEVPYPYVGANCVNRAGSLAQIKDDADPYPKPPNGYAWDSWNADSLPSCHHWRNAHEVPYPMVGANCANRAGSLAQIKDDADPYPKPPNGYAWDSWNKDSLPSCHHWRNAHEVPYPYVGANCANRAGSLA